VRERHHQQFQDLNHRYDLTQNLSQQASTIPSTLGAAAGDIQSVTVSVLEHLLAAITILALTFFLLLDGHSQGERLLARMPTDSATRWRRIAGRIAGVVKSYVSVNLVLAIAAGVFTWLALELLGVDQAVTLGVIVGFFDLVPLIGFTAGGFFVAIVAAFHNFPTTLIAWLVLFIVYQQVQYRVIQPLLYTNAVRVHPAVAIVAILAGGELAGILGALLAIPTAATIGVLIDEALLYPRETAASEESPGEPGVAGSPVPQPEPAPD
jgi:predicted PurR-regulated permease PerM